MSQVKMLIGQYSMLQRLNLDQHAESLYQAFALDRNGEDWSYLPYGPFLNYQEFCRWLNENALGHDPFFYAISDSKTMQPIGVASYLNIRPEHGVIEIGHVHYSPRLQRTTTATEAIYLLLRYAFDELGYRRVEWRCNAENKRSRRAAERLGFQFEGIFRQHAVYKNQNRDTAWFSILDTEWSHLKARLQHWLDPANFTANGQQKRALRNMGESSLAKAIANSHKAQRADIL